MATILDEILAWKRREELPRLPPVDRRLLADLPPCRDFRAALARSRQGPIRVVAECKQASPSAGLLVADYDPARTALFYVHGGASAISVLTDQRFFRGSLAHLQAVRAVVQLPLLRKDFLIDERQIAEARVAGADAVLLIAACLERQQLADLQGFARDLGLAVLVEVHDADEAATALAVGADPVGVNNRDLRDFSVDVQRTLELAPGLVDGRRVVVSESGIHDRATCRRLEEAGIDAVLVGEALMRERDPAAAIHRLRGTVASGLTG
ncbi:MAG: indole-3-glycerol phosphate synthase TrpC [Planctomycetota bacterium]|nr:indole-3-glycerol phosphate synthase TrpC [Planctomycetota bacterium]MDW8373591.1 indole-3-glycerol phosphate synthase TrpC [Planctomycetota bacterium]